MQHVESGCLVPSGVGAKLEREALGQRVQISSWKQRECTDCRVREGRWVYGYLEKGIQTPMAQGRSTKIISMIKWIRTSRLSI